MAKKFDAETRGVNIKLTADASSISQALRNLQRDLTDVQRSLRTVDSALKFDPSSVENLRKKVDLLNQKAGNLTTSISLLKGREEILRQEIEYANKAVQKNTEKYGENSAETEAAKKTRERLQNQLDKNTRKLHDEETTLGSLSDQLSLTENQISSVTRKSVTGMSEVDNNIAKLKSRLGDLDDMQKANAAGTKNATSALTAYGNQQEILSEKINVLKSLIGQYQVKVSQLKDEYEKQGKALNDLKNQEGNHAEEIQKAQNSYDQLGHELQKAEKELYNQKAALNATQGEYDTTSKKIQQLSEKEKDETEQKKESARAADNAKQSVDAFSVAIGNLASRAIEKSIDALKSLTKNVIETGVGFEDAMSGLAAIELKSKDSRDIQNLSDYFKELSTNSKYSATEIANNAQVLANAGYGVDQISSSISTLSNLAAGTGEDFNTMANTVVDGLAAFNMSSDESAHFANVLAKSAISANTNVSQMGEAFKYVGASAGSLGYSVEDVGLALDMMANNGIKASQGGTALRSIISRLSANTSKARDKFEELGGQFYKSNGEALPLRDVLDSLRKTLGKLNPEQKMQAMNTIAGVRGMTALAAIVNTSDKQFNDLTKDINNYNGTVDEMAGIRLDTVSGDVAKLKNNWANLSSEMTKNVEPGVRSVLQSLNNLMKSPAFQKDVAKMARSTSDALSSLAKWIDKNGESALQSAKNVGTFLAAFGGADLATNKILNIGSGFVSFGRDAKKALEMSKESSTGFLSNLVGISGEAGTLSLGIGAVSLAVAGLTAIVATNIQAAKEAKEAHEEELQEQYGLTSAMQDNVDKMKALNDSWKSTTKSTKENVEAVKEQYDGYRSMATQYDQIVDKNGKVTAGHEHQAQVIKSTLAQALGIESGQLDQLINKYGSMTAAIDQMIRKKEAEAVMSAYQDQYTEAVTKSGQALTNMLQAQADYETQQERYNQCVQAAKQAQDDYAAAVNNTTLKGDAYQKNVQAASDKMVASNEAANTAKKALDKLSGTVDKTKNTYQGYQDTIANYQGVSVAIANNDTAGVKKALEDLEKGFVHASDSNIQTLVKQNADASKQYELLQQAQKNHDSTVTNEAVQSAKDWKDKTYAELQKGYDLYIKSADQNGNTFVNTINSKKDPAVAAGKNVGDSAANATKNIYGFKDSAVSNMNTYNAEVNKKAQDSYKAGKNVANQTKSGSKTNLGAEGQQAGSTYASGVESRSRQANTSGRSLGNNAKSGSKVDLSSEGNNAGGTFVSGVDKHKGSAYTAGFNLANNLLSAIKKTLKIHSPSHVMTQLADYTGGAFTDRLDDYSVIAYKKAENIANQTIDGMNSVMYDRAQESAQAAKYLSDAASIGFNDSVYGSSGVFSRDVNTAGATVNNNNSTYSPKVVINITQRDGEDTEALARRVADVFNNDIRRKGAAWQ